MSIQCPKCSHEFLSTDQLCRKCKGTKFVEIEAKKKFSAGAQAVETIKTKTIICPRCNGSGLDIANKNRNNSKRGRDNEYKAVATFGDWWLKEDGSKYDWRKTPQSGGSQLAVGFDLAGDICTNAPNWPWSVECKRDKGWEFTQLLTTPTGGRLGGFIEQAVEDCPPHRLPMLWLMHPGPSQPTFIMLLAPIWSTYGSPGPGVITGDWMVKSGESYELYKYYIFNLDKFLMIPPHVWREHHDRYLANAKARR